MRSRVVGLVAAAALLSSVGIASAADDATANAKGPVTLTDNQLDKG
jgi:shikimate kinase